MAINYTQTDTNDEATINSYCAAAGMLSAFRVVCTNGGTAGTGTHTLQLSGEATSGHTTYKVIPGTGVSWNAGTWTVRVNITTANMNLTITAIHICRMNSSHNNVSTIGSATGLSIGLGTTGVKSQNVTGSAVGSPAADDYVLIVLTITNGSMTSQSAIATKGQNIDSPFDVPAVPQPTKPVMVRQAVNRAATY